MTTIDSHGQPDLHNTEANSGCHRCWCGCKYWEHDTCIDCGEKFDARNYDADGELVAP